MTKSELAEIWIENDLTYQRHLQLYSSSVLCRSKQKEETLSSSHIFLSFHTKFIEIFLQIVISFRFVLKTDTARLRFVAPSSSSWVHLNFAVCFIENSFFQSFTNSFVYNCNCHKKCLEKQILNCTSTVLLHSRGI